MLDPNIEARKPSVLEALRGVTRLRHARLASCPCMVRLFDSDYSTMEYRAHLGHLLGFFEPLEECASRVAKPSEIVGTLRRSWDLREDLFMMGASAPEIEALERCRRLPPISAQGLPGYAYVILGSSLGAQIIVRQLQATLGPNASVQFYGDEKGRYAALWASFLQTLEENGRGNIQSICSTASEIFDSYEQWLCR